MPAKAPQVSPYVVDDAASLGRQIRDRRKAIKVSITAAAESAGMSRGTWHRLEQGELSVTVGAYLAALRVLGMEFSAVAGAEKQGAPQQSPLTAVPLSIALADYPQLKRLAWQVHGVQTLSPQEALGLYERNWRHLDISQLQPHERALIDALRQLYGRDGSDV